MTIHFGTDGWRAVIADTFTFDNLRLLTQGIADAISADDWSRLGNGRNGQAPLDYDPRLVVVGFDTRFLSDRFAIEGWRRWTASNTSWRMIPGCSSGPRARSRCCASTPRRGRKRQ